MDFNVSNLPSRLDKERPKFFYSSIKCSISGLKTVGLREAMVIIKSSGRESLMGSKFVIHVLSAQERTGIGSEIIKHLDKLFSDGVKILKELKIVLRFKVG